ncbi:MAG TPA: nucleotide sugar dehydrogenase, partial [Anaerolineae bacterium]|nr:nucleotide sugar dehydrogenase [Anaerolineae bacterium]
QKIEMIQAGKSPIIEPGLADLIERGVQTGRLQATDNVIEAIARTEVAMICVGTPSMENGGLELKYLERVCESIGQALAGKSGETVVVVRSTVLPGTVQERLIPILEIHAGKQVGRDFGFCVNPEFLREGSAIADFDNPPYTVIGQFDARSGDQVARLYEQIEAPLYRVGLGAAEMVKYASNAFHALKVVFANEIGNICQTYGIDGHEVMDVFVQDTKLNLSPYYLKPGFAFGGSCLGKDVRALLYAARQRDTNVPVLESIIPSNHLQTQKAIDMLLREEKRKVGVLGLSFKSNTDDLRESPAVEMTERLIGKGFELHIYDREVSLSRLHGSNQAYLNHVIPHLSSLMHDSLAELVAATEAVVITKPLKEEEYSELVDLLRPDHTVIDLVRLNGRTIPKFEGVYHGICW